MRQLASFLVILTGTLGGCLRGNGEYHCTTNTECGTTGSCEASGLCSFTDSSCASGRRFGEFSGASANQCVSSMIGDQPPPDGPITPTPLQVISHAPDDAPNARTLTYQLTIPQMDSRFLLVSVHVGSDCHALVPNTASVTYAGVPLTLIDSITGTTCNESTTQSQQWGLVAPSIGTANVVVTLASEAFTVHSGAIAFAGVNQTSPVRSHVKRSGEDTAASVTIASAPGDLVIDTIAQGSGLDKPLGAQQTVIFIHNVDGSDSLNNSAASTAAGADQVTMSWQFELDPNAPGMADEWQSIVSSLQPAD